MITNILPILAFGGVASALVGEDGNLPDGTPYSIRVPDGWSNGILISDLDAASVVAANETLLGLLLGNGWAYSGTGRRADRDYHFDPAAERDSQIEVLDLFEATYGSPSITIQYGCSGGGGVALGVAEAFPNRVDGAVSANGGEGLVMSNNRLDLLFGLKALLAPNSSDLPMVGISLEDSDAAQAAWNETLTAALDTAPGRARVLLVGAIAQMPMWGGAFEPYLPEPDADDEAAVIEAMLRSVFDGATYAAHIRYLYDNPAGVMSWNTAIDYRSNYHAADPKYISFVEKLYHHARESDDSSKLDLDHDLETIMRYPRLAENATATEYWKSRALTGDIKVPVLQFSTVGDSSRNEALVSAYAQAVDKQGRRPLYRRALVEAAGHCTSMDSEIMAAIDAVLCRVQEGGWGDETEPGRLNERAKGYAEAGEEGPRFMSTDILPPTNFRAYLPE